KAKKFIWGLEQVKGEKAVSLGLADILVDDIEEGINELIQKLKASPLKAILASKAIFHGEKKKELMAMLKLEKDYQLKMMRTADHKEGITAFLEKRRPIFV